ncbi:UNVERIFIED_CONTAM: Rab proteins geranylgeranyltransferase component A [Siphonaria sp. JEL0065]|nr:Rab proteins geranylgeranyltransferase component A [Siphonaria sp. JEL0065]
MSDSKYDVLILGTGATEALLAAALSRHGLKVAHVDPNERYGGTGAVVSLEELLALDLDGCEKELAEDIAPLLKDSRRFTLELSPKLIYSSGSLVDVMIKSNVSNYLEFRALETTQLLWENALESVPCSKEDIFKNESIGLLEKRRLMKLLSQFVDASAATTTTNNDGEIGTVEQVDAEELSPFAEFLEKQGLLPKSRAILFNAIGLFLNKHDVQRVTKKEGIAAVKQYLGSIGRFGATPFLSGVYGTSSEVSQAFCRVCAVHGGTYILEYSPTSSLYETDEAGQLQFVFNGRDVLEKGNSEETVLATKWVVASPSCATRFQSVLQQSNVVYTEEKETKRISRCIAIYESKIDAIGEPGLIVIPPKDNTKNGIVAIQHSHNTLVCPSGKFVLYLSTESDATSTAKQDLGDALNSLIGSDSTEIKPLVTVFYTQTIETPKIASTSNRVIITKDSSETVGFEENVREAKDVFEHIVGTSVEFLPATENQEEDD